MRALGVFELSVSSTGGAQLEPRGSPRPTKQTRDRCADELVGIRCLYGGRVQHAGDKVSGMYGVTTHDATPLVMT